MTDSFRYVLREMPGIAEVERRYARVYPNGLAEIDDENDDVELSPAEAELHALVDRVSNALFGVTYDETFVSSYGFQTKIGFERAYREREQHFAFTAFDWPVQAPIWEAAGIDVTDGRGASMPCLEQFERQLVCARKGLAEASFATWAEAAERLGSLEERIADEAEVWAQNLLAGRRS